MVCAIQASLIQPVRVDVNQINVNLCDKLSLDPNVPRSWWGVMNGGCRKGRLWRQCSLPARELPACGCIEVLSGARLDQS